MNEYQTVENAGLGLIPVLFLLGIFLFCAYCQARMAKKMGLLNNSWWAYVPIVNTFLLFQMAGKPAWWFVLCLIPLVNVVVFAILWMETAKALGQSPFWGIMVLIPVINFFALGILAFSAGQPQYPTPPTVEEQPRQPQQVG